jgi:hypothetical protein
LVGLKFNPNTTPWRKAQIDRITQDLNKANLWEQQLSLFGELIDRQNI